MKSPSPSRLADIRRLLRTKSLWGHFPRNMRPLFLAQRGRCPYCPELLPLHTPLHATRGHPGTNRDHIWPKRLRSPRRPNDIVLAHQDCNLIKGQRHPHPCEVLFGRFVTEIVEDVDRNTHYRA